MPTKKQSANAKPASKRKRLSVQIVRQMLQLATSGFGLVAALAWNSVIQEFVNTQIKPFLPKGSGVISLFIYALVVTAIAVIVTYQLTQLTEKLEE